MKAILRSAVLAATAATALAMTTAPANAAGAVAFTGEATINCFGCGPSSGSANLAVTGTVNGTTQVATHGSWNATAGFSVNEPSATCPATGSASGSVSGAGFTVTFNWTRVGATAVITTAGHINGGGSAAFKADAALPCGAVGVKATFAGSVAGA
ncbi:MAG TPA: hypothetical protein VNA20_04650 [Frankiaceae bacterium]|nr:hypothetical protein [Frankiaceae bacterium]